MLEFQSTFPNSNDTHIFFPPLCSLPFPTSHIMPPKEIPWAETLRHLSTPHRCYHKRLLEKVMIWLNSSSKFDKPPQSPLDVDRNPFLQVARSGSRQIAVECENCLRWPRCRCSVRTRTRTQHLVLDISTHSGGWFFKYPPKGQGNAFEQKEVSLQESVR